MDSAERPPELETKATTATPYSAKGEELQDHSCQRIADLTKELLSINPSESAITMKTTCGKELKQYCIQRSKNTNVKVNEITLCINQFSLDPTEDLQYAILHMFRHPNDDLKVQLCTTLQQHPSLMNLLPKDRIKQLSSNQSLEVQQAMQPLLSF